MPTECWWYTVGVVYLLICYLLVGPFVAKELIPRPQNREAEVAFVWVISPALGVVVVPAFVLALVVDYLILRPSLWLTYGGRSDKRQ